jgi:capsular polysaccharide biosynthesis protein
MNNKKKFKLKNLYKILLVFIFNKVYGKIKKKIVKDLTNYQGIKVHKTNNEKYKIYEIQKCRIYTDSVNNTAYLNNNQIISGPSIQLRNFINQPANKNIVLKRGTPRFLKKFKGNVLSLVSGGAANNNFFHFIFDSIVRIGIFEKKFKNLKNINFFYIPDIKYPYQKQILEMLQIHKKSVPSKKIKHIYGDTIYSTDHPWQKSKNAGRDIENIPSWAVKWLRKKFIKKFSKCKIYKKIYIDRSDSNYSSRIIKNEYEIKKILLKKNFKIIKLTEYKFSEQIYLFMNAECIVSNHGAGLTNIIFCKKRTEIIEFMGPYTKKIYMNISSILNLNYKYIIGDASPHKIKNQNTNITVDLKKLENSLKIN